MSQPTTMILDSPRPFEALGENTRIALDVLREDGWKIDRLQNGQRLLLCAVPYVSASEAEAEAVRLRALEDARIARLAALDKVRRERIRVELHSLLLSFAILSVLPLFVGITGLVAGKGWTSWYAIAVGLAILNAAIGFLIRERHYA